MRVPHILRSASILAAAAALALSPSAFADAEPNEGPVQAEGPIAGGVDIAGVLVNPGAEADNDWYVFYVSGQQQLHLTSSSADSSCVSVTLHDAGGYSIGPDVTTPAGVTRYFVWVGSNSRSSCTSDVPYSFRLEPGAAVVAGPPMGATVETSEPNDTEEQAAGPLAAATFYGGQLANDTDRENFFFYTRPGTTTFTVTYGKGVFGCLPSDVWVHPSFYLLDSTGKTLQYKFEDIDRNELYTFTQTSTEAARYGVLVRGDSGCTWAFRVDPPEALTPDPPAAAAPPPPPVPPVKVAPKTSARCLSARKSRTRWTTKVKRTQKQLNRTHRATSKRKLRKRLAAEKRTLKRVRDKVIIYCP